MDIPRMKSLRMVSIMKGNLFFLILTDWDLDLTLKDM